jgi:hypothetical protein
MPIGSKRLQGWEDTVELVLSAWIIISPFLLGYFHIANASAVMIFLGTFIFLFSQLGLSTQEPWEEWVNLFLALLLIISPWMFGYIGEEVAMINAIASGICVAIFALISLSHEYSESRTHRAR